MNDFTLNPNEMKREINNYCTFLTKNVNKPRKKFVFEMMYGMAYSKSCLLSDISRALKEQTKLPNTINRLSDNLLMLNEEEKESIMSEYKKKTLPYFNEDDPISILDDSDVAKRCSVKLEDLDQVIDASSKKKEIVPGYHICEAVILTKKETQPISVYSKIYSCKSDDFVSMKKYTNDSIDTVRNTLNRPCTFTADRAYDDKKIYKYIESKGDYFVIRLDNRNLYFKGKSRNIKEVAKSRKGKILMNLWFEGEEKRCYISQTKVQLEKDGKEYTFIVVYALGDEPLMLLTNREIKDYKDVRRCVRIYFSRWRIEEYFKIKKQEYKFEKYLVRNLESMNTLNMILTMLMGLLGILAEKIDTNILSIKIIYASESLVERPIVWLGQVSRGIGKILSLARTGIKELMKIEQRSKIKQLSFNI